MKALVYERSPLRYAVAIAASRFGAKPGRFGPVEIRDIDPPALPGDEWSVVKPTLTGICGSDIVAVTGRTSGYFEQVVSFPFTLGHEIVGRLDDGTRVVVEPALGCKVRGVQPLCRQCAQGRAALCENSSSGSIARGSQTGFCKSTGGGWAERLVAHNSQLHPIPDDLSDEAAVMIEPAACAIHAASKASTAGAHVAVVGAGTLGLLTTAAVAKTKPASLTVSAKYPQQRRFATEFGATGVCPPNMLLRSVRSATQTHLIDKGTLAAARLTGGADAVFDCVGNSASIDQALTLVRPGGRVVLVGMPGSVTVDLAPLWQREVEITGAYCYAHDGATSDFATAMTMATELDLERLVTATYPLARYRDALDHASNAGALGAVKIAFDLR